MAGAILHWLRDVGLIGHASESEPLAASLPHTEGVVLVPAFVGLGAPYWDSEARAALVGLTRGTTRAHIVRAGLEAVSYQTLDLLNAMRADGVNIDQLKVDGGMVSNAWWLQHLSDTLAVPVLKSTVAETTAWGAALLAGLGAGCFETLPVAAPASGYQPLNQLSGDYQHWLRAVARVR
jgi:glycerol kinase